MRLLEVSLLTHHAILPPSNDALQKRQFPSGGAGGRPDHPINEILLMRPVNVSGQNL